MQIAPKSIVTALFCLIWTNSPVRAFTINYENSPVLDPVSYEIGDVRGRVWIDPIEKLPPPSDKFIKAFESLFPEWEFESSYTPINGNINIQQYRPCNPQYIFGCERFAADGQIPIFVGAKLDLEYEPKKYSFFDPELGNVEIITEFPDPNTGRVHWLQWVENNHKVEGGNDPLQGHGINERIIDTYSDTPFYYGNLLKGNPEDPLYFSGNKQDPYQFHDIPGRVDFFLEHDWTANLYLAYQKNNANGDPQKVQIFGGIRWGWHNRIERSCPASRVDSKITPVGNKYLYEFEVFNTSPVAEGDGYGSEICDEIVNWELPLFDVGDLDVASISSPSGWDFEILPPDGTSDYYNNSDSPYNFSKWNYSTADDPILSADSDWYGSNPEVFEDPPLILHWYNVADSDGFPTNSIFPENSLAQFSFLSDFAPKNAPYLSSWYTRPPNGGDPPIPFGSTFATPNSPSRQIAQNKNNVSTSVPESDMLLGLLSVGILSFWLKSKN